MIKLKLIKAFFVASILLFIGCNCSNDELVIGKASIIPKPAELVVGEGYFEIDSNTVVSVENEDQKRIANQVFEHFQTVAGWKPEVVIGNDGQILLHADSAMKSEGYELEVTTSKIEIKASSGAGYFYALQSLIQILPVEYSDSKLHPNFHKFK